MLGLISEQLTIVCNQSISDEFLGKGSVCFCNNTRYDLWPTAHADSMGKTKSKSVLAENDLHSEDGYPSPQLVTEAYRVWDKYFGKIEIVSCGPSVTDLIKEMLEQHPEMDANPELVSKISRRQAASSKKQDASARKNHDSAIQIVSKE